MNPGFEEIIGIRGNANLISRYGLYLDDLPMMAWATIADYAPQGKSAEDFFAHCYEVSVNDVISRASQELSKYFQSNNSIDYVQAGRYDDTPLYNTALNAWRGVKITQNRRPGCHDADPLAGINVPEFDFLCNTTGNVSFRVRDINGNLWTKTIACTAGQIITIPVNVRSLQKFVYIESNNNGVLTAKSKVGNCPGGCSVTSAGNNLKMEGFNGTNTGSEAFGIIARATLVCDEAKLNCWLQESHAWRQALLYQMAVNVLSHSVVSTTRTNPGTTRQLSEREAQREEWQIRVNTHLKIFREGSVDLMRKLTTKTGCIICNGGHYVG